MTDIEISKNSKKLNIVSIGNKLGLNQNDLILYGDYKAKIKENVKGNKNGKLVLVTAISPTPFGEGKTTVSIGLTDALSKLSKSAIAALREPSMGPVFGQKGGATGGGYAQVVPMEDINLHFTGDIHAITSANNLLCAAIDNHIYYGNELDIQKVTFTRCLDVNDRTLRDSNFTISSASEIMALFCLATDSNDLREKLGNIVVGQNSKDEYVYAKDLNIVGSMMALLKDAFNPNLVQTLENNPVIIHGGPFANIAHGCSSIKATKLSLSLADYVITEAGFGADLGAEKFFDIKCPKGNIKPSTVILVSTIKALKYHGGVKKEDIFMENDEALEKGFANLDKHFSNLKKFGVDVIVCLNKYNEDKEDEINKFIHHANEMNYTYSISNAYQDGSDGAIDLANKVINIDNSNFHPLYDINDTIENKIDCIAKDIYGASKVNYSNDILNKIEIIKKNGKDKLPICIAKTQYSFTDDKNIVGAPKDFEVTIKDIKLYSGAGFITVLLGNIMTMPGLNRKPNYELIDFIDDEIINLS